MPDDDLRDAANTLLELCKARKLTLATAESCTGGLGRRDAERNSRLIHSFSTAAL